MNINLFSQRAEHNNNNKNVAEATCLLLLPPLLHLLLKEVQIYAWCWNEMQVEPTRTGVDLCLSLPPSTFPLPLLTDKFDRVNCTCVLRHSYLLYIYLLFTFLVLLLLLFLFVCHVEKNIWEIYAFLINRRKCLRAATIPSSSPANYWKYARV